MDETNNDVKDKGEVMQFIKDIKEEGEIREPFEKIKEIGGFDCVNNI